MFRPGPSIRRDRKPLIPDDRHLLATHPHRRLRLLIIPGLLAPLVLAIQIRPVTAKAALAGLGRDIQTKPILRLLSERRNPVCAAPQLSQ